MNNHAVVDQFIHPEAKEDEIFFTNISSQAFEQMNFKTKRFGEIAYDGNGNQLHTFDWHPSFLKKSEVENTGKSLAELRRDFWRKMEHHLPQERV